MLIEQTCPICSKAVPLNARYPHHVCEECKARACASDGRPLMFYNESASGGFVAYYADTNEVYASHECFIDGIRCHADEAYLGGIVIQPML